MDERIKKIDCPACDGHTCEQCDGYGYVFVVPNDMDPAVVRQQIAAYMRDIEVDT